MKNSENNLKKYWRFLKVDNSYMSCNTITQRGLFTRNIFVNNFDDFKRFVDSNYKTNCYMTYNPLKENNGKRVFSNLHSINVIAFDIEYKDKKKPEKNERLIDLYNIVYEQFKKYNIDNYMINLSGNGIHLFLKMKNRINENISEHKDRYKQTIKKIQGEINKNLEDEFKISIDDRVDINGILRIPETHNVNSKRIVKIVDVVESGENDLIQEIYDGIKFDEVKSFGKKIFKSDNSKLVPKNLDEFYKHPFVRIWINEKKLPSHSKKHNTIIMSLQILARDSGISVGDLKQVENDIKYLHDKDFTIEAWNEDIELYSAYRVFINWCDNYDYSEYSKECNEILESVDMKKSDYVKNKKEFLSKPYIRAKRYDIRKYCEDNNLMNCLKCGHKITLYDEYAKFECKKCGKYGSIKALQNFMLNKKYNTYTAKKGDLKK